MDESMVVFDMVRTLEVDTAIGEEPILIRLEIFRARDKTDVYRVRLWRQEMFRMRPSFPQDDDGEPTEVSDDEVLAEWSQILEGDYELIEAASEDEVERKVLEDLRRSLAAASWAV